MRTTRNVVMEQAKWDAIQKLDGIMLSILNAVRRYIYHFPEYDADESRESLAEFIHRELVQSSDVFVMKHRMVLPASVLYAHENLVVAIHHVVDTAGDQTGPGIDSASSAVLDAEEAYIDASRAAIGADRLNRYEGLIMSVYVGYKDGQDVPEGLGNADTSLPSNGP